MYLNSIFSLIIRLFLNVVTFMKKIKLHPFEAAYLSFVYLFL